MSLDFGSGILHKVGFCLQRVQIPLCLKKRAKVGKRGRGVRGCGPSLNAGFRRAARPEDKTCRASRRHPGEG